MKRRKWTNEQKTPIVKRIREIKSDHPFLGDRRVWAHLNDIDKMPVR